MKQYPSSCRTDLLRLANRVRALTIPSYLYLDRRLISRATASPGGQDDENDADCPSLGYFEALSGLPPKVGT
jgi:hypothetical protein